MLIVALIILQLVIFSALIFFFRKVLSQNVSVATHHLDELSHNFDEKQKQIDNQMEESKAKADKLLSEAREEIERSRQEIVQNAERERDRLVSEARGRAEEIIQHAEKSRYQLLAELEQRINKASIQKASELIGEVLPETFKKDVHRHWTEELLKGSFAQLEEARLPSDLKQVMVTSAFPLEEEERQVLFKKLKNKVGKDIPIKEEVDPKVVAGFVISIGSLIIDGSLRERITEQAKSAQSANSES